MNEERNSIIGQELQDARLERGLSLDDIQQTTKIQKRYLAAIENGQFDQLPGTFYERAFIRQYATAVGLDVAEFVQTHDLENKSVEPDLSAARIDSDNVTRTGMHHIEESAVEKTRQMLPKLIIGAAVVIIIAVIWALVAAFAGSAKQEQTTSTVSVSSSKVVDSEKAAKPASSTTDASKESSAKDASSEKKPKADVELGDNQVTGNMINYADVKVPADKELTMTLKTTGPSWIQVSDASGAVLWNGTLQENGMQDVKIPANVPGVRVSIGNALATAVSLDGESVALQSGNASVWNLSMTFMR